MANAAVRLSTKWHGIRCKLDVVSAEQSGQTRAALRVIVEENGPEALASAGVMANLLKDLLPDAPRIAKIWWLPLPWHWGLIPPDFGPVSIRPQRDEIPRGSVSAWGAGHGQATGDRDHSRRVQRRWRRDTS